MELCFANMIQMKMEIWDNACCPEATSWRCRASPVPLGGAVTQQTPAQGFWMKTDQEPEKPAQRWNRKSVVMKSDDVTYTPVR